jgi:hypothetical protein
MEWEAIGAIGELIGATAVVLTLIFLAVQLRQNTKAVEDSRNATVSQLYQYRAGMHMDGMLRMAESSGLSFIEIQGKIIREGLDSLQPEEREFLRLHSVAAAVRLDNGLFQHSSGFLDDDYAEYVESVVARMYPIWDELGVFDYGFRPGFIQQVKKIAEQRGSA